MILTDFGFPEVDLDENNCDSMKRAKSPEKKAITACVGSYASVLKGREKNKMSGNFNVDALTLIVCQMSKTPYQLNMHVNRQITSHFLLLAPPTESDKCRDLFEAIEYPPKTMFEDVQFPPVTAVRAE